MDVTGMMAQLGVPELGPVPDTFGSDQTRAVR